MDDDVLLIQMPAAWASAIVNGDFSGLDRDEADEVRQAIADISDMGYDIVGTTDDEYFSWHPDYGPPGLVKDYIALKRA